jgi:hypothetical protein
MEAISVAAGVVVGLTVGVVVTGLGRAKIDLSRENGWVSGTLESFTPVPNPVRDAVMAKIPVWNPSWPVNVRDAWRQDIALVLQLLNELAPLCVHCEPVQDEDGRWRVSRGAAGPPASGPPP